MLKLNNADVYTDFNGLAKLKSEARKESPEALKEAAKQFEAIFLNSVLKNMREAKLADGIIDNDQSKFYSEMYDQQLAVHLSGSVGLADLVVKQMKHEKPDNEKMNLEDYLNRSSTSSKAITGQHGAVDSQSGKKTEARHDEPDNEKLGFEKYLSRASTAPHVITGQPRTVDHQAGSKVDFESTVDDLNNSSVNGSAEIQLKNDRALPIQSTQDFVRRLLPFAERAAKELGVEPKVILAQAALETNWGRSLIKNSNGDSSFNLFNIKADKAWQGRQAQVKTLEFDQGIGKKVNAGFRSYASFEESFQDYVNFIKSNPRYGDALKQVGNPELYMRKLQQAGYATDPKYADKVIKIYHGNTMSEFQPDIVMAMNNQAR